VQAARVSVGAMGTKSDVSAAIAELAGSLAFHDRLLSREPIC